MNEGWRLCWRCGVPWHSSEVPVIKFDGMLQKAVRDLGTDERNVSSLFVCPSCVQRPAPEISGPVSAMIMTVERGHRSRAHLHWQPSPHSRNLYDEQSLSYAGPNYNRYVKKRRLLSRLENDTLLQDLNALIRMRCISAERDLCDLPPDALPFRQHPVAWVPVIFTRRWLEIVNRLRRHGYRVAGLTMKQCPKALRTLDQRTFSFTTPFRHASLCVHCAGTTWISRSISFKSSPESTSVLCTRLCTQCEQQCGISWTEPLPEPPANHCIWAPDENDLPE